MMTTRTTTLIAIGGILAGGLGAPAAADIQYFDYADWHVTIDTVDTGEDLRTTCRIRTGGDGDPTLSVEISNGDVLPPAAYPDVVLSEGAPRGYDTMLQDGMRVGFLTGNGQGFEGVARRWISDEGFIEAAAAIDPGQTLWALQAMAEGGVFEISTEKGMLYTASFQGFREAYSHMAAACGFSTEGVLYDEGGYEVEQAPTQFFSYKGWHVMIEDASNSEHDLTICSAYTGTEGSTGIFVTAEMRDGEPPSDLPAIMIGEERLEDDGGSTSQDAPIQISFDDGRGLVTQGTRWTDPNGDLQARAVFFDNRELLPLLRAMRGGREVYVSSERRLVSRHSLMGFTAAYGKIAEKCRFSPADVIR